MKKRQKDVGAPEGRTGVQVDSPLKTLLFSLPVREQNELEVLNLGEGSRPQYEEIAAYLRSKEGS